jgi:hypothetical protein
MIMKRGILLMTSFGNGEKNFTVTAQDGPGIIMSGESKEALVEAFRSGKSTITFLPSGRRPDLTL